MIRLKCSFLFRCLILEKDIVREFFPWSSCQGGATFALARGFISIIHHPKKLHPTMATDRNTNSLTPQKCMMSNNGTRWWHSMATIERPNPAFSDGKGPFLKPRIGANVAPLWKLDPGQTQCDPT